MIMSDKSTAVFFSAQKDLLTPVTFGQQERWKVKIPDKMALLHKANILYAAAYTAFCGAGRGILGYVTSK